MKKIVFLGVSALMVASSSVVADDGVIRMRAGLSSNSFDTLWSGGDLETDYTSLNLGLSYITESQWYYDVAYKTDTSATWNTRELSPGFNDGKDEDYGRRDLTLTVGKVLENGVALFIGYQNSAATMALPVDTWQAAGSVSEEEFDVKGFYFGVGRSFSVGEGSLNLNASYGKMDGELVDAGGFRNEGDDGKGYSLGLAYTYVLGSNTSLTFEAKRQSYSYEYDSEFIFLTGGDDNMTTFGINLNYQI